MKTKTKIKENRFVTIRNTTVDRSTVTRSQIMESSYSKSQISIVFFIDQRRYNKKGFWKHFYFFTINYGSKRRVAYSSHQMIFKKNDCLPSQWRTAIVRQGASALQIKQMLEAADAVARQD